VGAPADAIREFVRTLAELRFRAKPHHMKDDVADLRRAFPSDSAFAQALRAVTNRLRNLRAGEGVELDHDLDGWSRVKFSSGAVDHADLRIIFRSDRDGFELRAFGHRHEPESVYFRAATRH
jgi:hypothetical protein